MKHTIQHTKLHTANTSKLSVHVGSERTLTYFTSVSFKIYVTAAIIPIRLIGAAAVNTGIRSALIYVNGAIVAAVSGWADAEVVVCLVDALTAITW